MTPQPVFLLDANVLMTAARHYYAFDIAPGFWSALSKQAVNGELRSIDRVHDEINRGEDELVSWVNHTFLEYFFRTDTSEILGKYTEIITWAQAQQRYPQAVKQDFARFEHADPWLVAYACVHGCVIVTLEKHDPMTKKKIPIPNICEAFGVQCLNTFDMLRQNCVQIG